MQPGADVASGSDLASPVRPSARATLPCRGGINKPIVASGAQPTPRSAQVSRRDVRADDLVRTSGAAPAAAQLN